MIKDLVTPRQDIIALQEVEGQRVISDLVYDLLRGRYHVAIAPQSKGATQVALLSRFPIRRLRVHLSVAVAVNPGRSALPPVKLWGSREMIDAEIEVKSASEIIRVIASHWKSQSGGERETEARRIQSAALLRTMLSVTDGDLLTLIVGDLNEDVREFDQHGGTYPTALLPYDTIMDGPERIPPTARSLFVTSDPAKAGIRSQGVVLFSPWLTNPTPGTYFHAGRWERLDQVLILPGSGHAPEASLRVIDDAALVSDDGRPARYDPRTGYGYSDHLPLVIQLDLG